MRACAGDLDDACRDTEIDHFAKVKKDRTAADYRACWPRGLSDLVAARGAEQARSVRALVAELERHVPDLHAKHGARLLELAVLTEQRERAWNDAEVAAGQAFTLERIARASLIEQLRKNEGALREIYPGQARKVRSFFRPDTRKRKKADATEETKS